MADKMVYTDGMVEDRIIEYLRKTHGNSSKIIEDIPEGAVFHNFSPARENLVLWYPFKKGDTVLEIGAGMGAITQRLAAMCGKVVALEPSPKRAEIISLRCAQYQNVEVVTESIGQYVGDRQFDYVLLLGVLEYAGVGSADDDPWTKMLTCAGKYLKPTGKILVAIENKYGLKYWCGAAEDHTGIPFDSINGYELSNGKTERYETCGVRTFSKAELERIMIAAGLNVYRHFYPLPDYKFPMLILSDKSRDMDIVGDVKFNYPEESLLIADPQKIYPDLVDNKCVDFFANSFLVEAGIADRPNAENEVATVSIKRDYLPNYRVANIHSGDVVIRKACNEFAVDHLRELVNNTNELMKRGIPCIKQTDVTGDETLVKRMDAPRADKVFGEAIRNGDSRIAFAMIERLREYILKSGELTVWEGYPVLSKGFPDLTFRNSFWINNDLVFFDQEWELANTPVNYVLFRAIKDSAKERNKLYYAIVHYCGISDEEIRQFEMREQQFLESLMDKTLCTWFDNTMYQDRLLYSSKVKAAIANREAHIEQLLQSERDLKKTVLDQVQEIALLGSELRDKKIGVSELTEDVDKLKGRNVELADSVSQLNEKNQNQQGHIELLLESDRELQRIKASRSWRFMGYVWRLRDWLLPKGSRRRLLCKMLIRFVKHPIRFLSKCTPKKVAKFFKTLHQEGVEGTSRKLDDCLLYPQGVVSSLKISPVDIQVQKAKDDYAPLQVPKWEKPEVSIIIPVYNQFDYTYACLESIIKNSGDVAYEILIADDCSSDLTEQIDDIIGGLHTIHNEKNLRFLLNCNHAAKQARGEYILFLNNDTQVQENWLEPLVSLMQKDPSIGMTGSKLVYPDGRLQEAGGILWSDGSAWNYGNRSDPNAPEYNYVKEVDYISGASICIRRELWEEIGGFDERFVPAYCEDSDLAFEVRRHGYKVVYQPLSVVVHFEGVSNGTDVASGQKAYQVVNQKKFFEKWQQILTQDHYPNGENVFLARERGRNAKVLLMVDHYVPQYDKDAGSRTVFQYLKLFAESGYHVKFIGDNFFPHQPYTQVLQQMGVEVLYGNWYAKNWKEWLRENGSCIEYAFLNRPHISVKYIDEVRKYTKAFIAYYGHDLHFLREYREYELTGDKGHLQDSVEWKEKELALMRKADIAYYPSVVEEQEIHRIAPEVNIKAIPAYLFADVPDADYSASSRQDVMFIGGFGHRPNVDAVVWLAKEIMPRLSASLPGLVVHILGSNPPKEVTDLQTENLRIEGFVTDERLEQYYRECRMAIIPLRYGAGIKGKVVEAMRYGMPVLTTSVGAEGIIGAEKILAVEDTPEDFAARFVSLYEDHATLERVSRQEVAYIRENYSPANAIRVIGKEFDMEDLRS